MVRRILLAGVGLVLSVATAHATVYYATGISAASAPGTIASGGNDLAVGGICIFGSSNCISSGTEGAYTAVNGQNLIQVTSGGNYGLGDYFLKVTIIGQGSAARGSIWDVTVTDGTTGTSLGTTGIVNSSGVGGGVVSGIVTGNGNFDIGITDLFEQYQGIQDTLPGFLSVSGVNDPANTTVSSPFAGFSFSYTLTAVPEPASAMLFVGGLAALRALRRRPSDDGHA